MIDLPHSLLRAMFDAAVGAALPERIVPRHLPAPPKGRTIVLGAGKASAAMAKAVEEHWPGRSRGWWSPATAMGCPAGTSRSSRRRIRFRMLRGQAAASASWISAGRAGPDDLVLCLISGGGSALLALPAAGIDAGGQAGGQQGAARQRCRHRPDERRSASISRRSRVAGSPPRRIRPRWSAC